MQITRYQFKIGKKLKFVFLSDLHGFKLKPIIDAVEKILPDAVLVGGDFIHSNEDYESGLLLLKEMASRYTTFASIGNHERRFSENLYVAVNKTGAYLLDNDFTDFRGVKIGGLSAPYERKHCKSEAPELFLPKTEWLKTFEREEGFKILLCHRPEYFERYLLPLEIDLTLSGHAHGGQWRIFGKGIFSPGQGVFPKYTFGSYFGSRLIVGKGLGNGKWVPRINNPAEIVVIETE